MCKGEACSEARGPSAAGNDPLSGGGTGEPLLFMHGVAGERRPLAQGRPAALDGLPLHRAGPGRSVLTRFRCSRMPTLRRPALRSSSSTSWMRWTFEQRRSWATTRGERCPSWSPRTTRSRRSARPDLVRRLRVLPAAVFKPLGTAARLPGATWLTAQALRLRRPSDPDRLRLGHQAAPGAERGRFVPGAGQEVGRRAP